MGFMVSFSLFFLAIVINQSTVVGQTTAESGLGIPEKRYPRGKETSSSKVSFTLMDNNYPFL